MMCWKQGKDTSGLTGYKCSINGEKSRYVREKTKIAVEVSFEGGISKWSGLMDTALAGNFVTKPSNGWYARVDRETGENVEPKVLLAETLKEEFWTPIFEFTDFAEFLKKQYQIGLPTQVDMDEIAENAEA